MFRGQLRDVNEIVFLLGHWVFKVGSMIDPGSMSFSGLQLTRHATVTCL